MIFARARFAVALIAFLAWLGWLAVAVAKKGDPVLSRAQLLNATHLVYAEVTVGDDGLPRSPGYDAADPVRPVIYPATDATRVQLNRLLTP